MIGVCLLVAYAGGMTSLVRGYMNPPRPQGKAWEDIRKRVYADWGPWCWICGCPTVPGCTFVDHVEPVAERPDLAWSQSNLRPVHHSNRRKGNCPVCSVQARRAVNCNGLRQSGSVGRARRKIAEIISDAGGTVPPGLASLMADLPADVPVWPPPPGSPRPGRAW